MQAVKPVLVEKLFPEILAKLLEFLENLSPEEWDTPTICAPWTVKDLTAHLLGDELGILSRGRDKFSYAGDPLRTWQELVSFIDWQNEQWVTAAKRLSPAVMLDLMKHVGEQTCTYFQSFDPFELGKPVEWTGNDPAPRWVNTAREYTERWVHQQQLREAVGREGLMQPHFFKPVLEAFVLALPHTYRNVAVTEGTTVTLTIQGDSGFSRTVVREGDKWKLYEGAPEKPTSQVFIPQDTAWRLFTRNISPLQALEFTVIKGDKQLGLQTLQMVSIIVDG
jgi:uncharacterized protein (TIGR03083 family)